MRRARPKRHPRAASAAVRAAHVRSSRSPGGRLHRRSRLQTASHVTRHSKMAKQDSSKQTNKQVQLACAAVLHRPRPLHVQQPWLLGGRCPGCQLVPALAAVRDRCCRPAAADVYPTPECLLTPRLLAGGRSRCLGCAWHETPRHACQQARLYCEPGRSRWSTQQTRQDRATHTATHRGSSAR